MHNITAALLNAWHVTVDFAVYTEARINNALESLHAAAIRRVYVLAQAAAKLAETERASLQANFIRMLTAADKAVESTAEKLRAAAQWAEAELAKLGRTL